MQPPKPSSPSGSSSSAGASSGPSLPPLPTGKLALGVVSEGAQASYRFALPYVDESELSPRGMFYWKRMQSNARAIEKCKAAERAALIKVAGLRHAERLARLESASANVLANGQEARRLRAQLFAHKMESERDAALAYPGGPVAYMHRGGLAEHELDYVSADDKYRAQEKVNFEADRAAAVAAKAVEDEAELTVHRATSVSITEELVRGFREAEAQLAKSRADFEMFTKDVEADFHILVTRKDVKRKAVRGALKARSKPGETLPSIPEQGAGAPVAPPPPVRYQSVQFRVKPDPRFVNMQRTRSTVGPDGEVVRVELIGQKARDAFAEASNVSAAAFIQRQVSLPMLKRNATSLLTNKR